MRAWLVAAPLVLCSAVGGMIVSAPAEVSSTATAAAAPVAAAAAPTTSYVASAAAARNSAAPWITIPAAVQPGDRLVLFVSLNAAGQQVSPPSGGWSLEGDRTSRTMRTLLWSKVATTGDPGSRVTVTLSGSAKATVQVAAYRGTGDGSLVVGSAADTTTSATRRTPVVAAPADAWVLSYWASKSAATTSWTPPGAVTARGSAANTGSGRIASLLGDTGGPVAGGSYGDLVATSDATSTAATTWTVALPPATDVDPGVVEVPAGRETTPVAESGDAADDPAIWVDPDSPGDSLVIGNDKQGALEVYGLDGVRRQRITTATSFWGNVDVRQDVTVGTRTLDVVVAYNNGLRTFAVDPATRLLQPVGDGTGAVPTNGGEGLCAYHSAVTDDLYVFVITRAGRVRQYLIHDSDGDGLLQGSMVREFSIGSEAEGCVADDATGRLYISEEDVGLWRYGAEPGDGATRTLVDAVAPDGHLAYDVEGVTLATTGAASGYVIVSAQNGAHPDESYFAVYDRATNDYVSSFRISASDTADGCERTDGIAATTAPLGPDFPAGLFVCQDNGNTAPAAGNQNFKLTRLDDILP